MDKKDEARLPVIHLGLPATINAEIAQLLSRAIRQDHRVRDALRHLVMTLSRR